MHSTVRPKRKRIPVQYYYIKCCDWVWSFPENKQENPISKNVPYIPFYRRLKDLRFDFVTNEEMPSDYNS